ncbi:MAG: metalloendopeptidase-like rane protein [Clostridia bacterium]|jgi:murein DD-endopeptidase MepM/ murein hydrolase activator NlpD|nr:metalloendopeptidase-like rane protein [Clostridia bacterium]
MVFDRQKKAKKYNILIVPERGNRTRKLNLSSLAIKGAVGFLLIAIISTALFIFDFSNRYKSLSEEASALKNKDEYIKVLEKDNKDKDTQIKSYKAYQATINNKMEELNELEQDIKDKLGKSSFLTDGSSLKDMAAAEYRHMPIPMQMSSIAEEQTSIETINNKIQSLTAINKQLDKVLEKEQYVPSVVPCQGRITSYFGMRANPFDQRGDENHPAIDIACDYGTKIHATAKGKVVYAEYRKGYGNCVCLDHGNGLTSLYGHASKLLVEEGQVINKGEVIALVGSTGRSTGPHVHFELRKDDVPINPIKIFK